jgi:hypothetical protein
VAVAPSPKWAAARDQAVHRSRRLGPGAALRRDEARELMHALAKLVVSTPYLGKRPAKRVVVTFKLVAEALAHLDRRGARGTTRSVCCRNPDGSLIEILVPEMSADAPRGVTGRHAWAAESPRVAA